MGLAASDRDTIQRTCRELVSKMVERATLSAQETTQCQWHRMAPLRVAPLRHAWSKQGDRTRHPALAACNSTTVSGCSTSLLAGTCQGGNRPLMLVKHQDESQV